MEARILIVDDNQMLLRTLATYLARQGYQVDTAGSGAAARERLQAATPEVVIFDVRLPDCEGFDLVDLLRWRGLRIPVVLMSAENHRNWLRRAVDAGAAAFLYKPFALSTMRQVLSCVLSGQRCFPMCSLPDGCAGPGTDMLRPD